MTTIADPAEAEYSARNTARIELLSLASITPSPQNPRKVFGETALEELAASIRQHGLLQPIVVRPVGDRWSIVAGERRWRAARIAGLTAIPAVIREDLGDEDALRLALIENLQREDLDPIEEAEGYRRLQESGMRQTAIAAAVNRSQPAVANAMRLLDLPEDVRERIRAGKLTVSHGIALARFAEYPGIVSKIAEVAVEKSLTAKALEKGVPEAGALERAKLIKYLDYGTVFDKETCKQCPFGAYRAGGDSYFPACLKPEHYEELNEAAKAQRVAAREAAIAAAGGDESALPKLADLRWEEYERVDRAMLPAGCDGACPCRGAAMSHGDEVVPICTNPARYRELAKAEQTAREEQRQAAIAAEIALIEAAVDGLGAGDPRLYALLAATVLAHVRNQAARAEAIGRWLPEMSRAISQKDQYAQPRVDLAMLATMPALEMLRACVEALLRTEAIAHASWNREPTPMTDWLLQRERPPAEDEEDEDDGDDEGADDEAPAVVLCTQCRRPNLGDLAEDPPTGPCWHCQAELPEWDGRTTAEIRMCRECNCTDEAACEGGCSWVEADLCSACEEDGLG